MTSRPGPQSATRPGPVPVVGEAGIEILSVSKSFPGQRVLTDVSMSLTPGHVHGLIGHNGSGKSTLVKILAGYHRPESGSIRVAGKMLAFSSADYKNFADNRIGFVHQDLALWRSMSVLENLYRGRYYRTLGGVIDWPRMHTEARKWLSQFELDLPLDAAVEELSPALQASIAIVRATRQVLLSGGGLLVLDEPTAYLSTEGVSRLFDVVRRATEAGTAVLFIGHDLQEIVDHTDTVTVLRNGHVVARHVRGPEVTAKSLTRDMLGADAAIANRSVSVQRRRTELLRISGCAADGIHDVSLTLRSGEIVGVTGLMGSGFDVVPYAAFGAVPARGTVWVRGEERPLQKISPTWCRQHGVAFVPADRAGKGGLLSSSARDNVNMLSLKKFTGRFNQVRSRLESENARRLLTQYSVLPHDPEKPFGLFSGGNQQKMILAKWISTAPAIILMHEPTAGVDVGAKLEILELLRRTATGGAGLLIASTEYDDLAELCDRVIVMARGTIAQEFSGEELTGQALVFACQTDDYLAESGSGRNSHNA